MQLSYMFSLVFMASGLITTSQATGVYAAPSRRGLEKSGRPPKEWVKGRCTLQQQICKYGGGQSKLCKPESPCLTPGGDCYMKRDAVTLAICGDKSGNDEHGNSLESFIPGRDFDKALKDFSKANPIKKDYSKGQRKGH